MTADHSVGQNTGAREGVAGWNADVTAHVPSGWPLLTLRVCVMVRADGTNPALPL